MWTLYISTENIKDANEAVKGVGFKRALHRKCSFSGESLGMRLCSKCSKIKDLKFHSKVFFDFIRNIMPPKITRYTI